MSVRKRFQGKVTIIDDKGIETNFSEDFGSNAKMDDVSVTPTAPTAAPTAAPASDSHVPPRYFIGIDLKAQLPEYEKRRRDLKHSELQSIWERRIGDLLAVYDPSGDQYHIALVKSIMQIVEKYLIYSDKLGPVKKQIVMAVCEKFFDGNKKLLSAIIEREMETLKQTTWLSKFLARIEIYFFSKI